MVKWNLLWKIEPIALKSNQKVSHSYAMYIFMYCRDDVQAWKGKKKRSKLILTWKQDKATTGMHQSPGAHQTKVNSFRNVRETSTLCFKHVEYSAFSLCITLIQRSSRSPADSTVWYGKQPVVRQLPSVWRLEAACWPLFNVNTVLHTAGWWIFHHKCHSSSQMTSAP